MLYCLNWSAQSWTNWTITQGLTFKFSESQILLSKLSYWYTDWPAVYFKSTSLQTLSLKTCKAYQWENVAFQSFFSIPPELKWYQCYNIKNFSDYDALWCSLLYDLHWYFDVPSGKTLNFADNCHKAYSWCLVSL